MNIHWDADKYTKDFSFVHEYGNGVLGLLDAVEGGRALDLGCGNGALTEALQSRGFAVTGLDASPEFLEIARRVHPGVVFLLGDAADFSLPEPVDAVFSNAVFHWIDRERQPNMLRCVLEALKPGGQFVFEFGGAGNNRRIHEALTKVFAAHGYAYNMPFFFPTIGEYAGLLERAGFRVVYAALFDRPTLLAGQDGMKDWMRLFLMTPLSAIRTQGERNAMLDEAAEMLRPELYQDGKWYADYVRLRMKAVRP